MQEFFLFPSFFFGCSCALILNFRLCLATWKVIKGIQSKANKTKEMIRKKKQGVKTNVNELFLYIFSNLFYFFLILYKN